MENDVEYSSYDIRDKLMAYIERHKLSDKNTRRPNTFDKKNKSRYDRKDGKD